MTLRIFCLGVLSIGLATSAMAQQSQPASNALPSADAKTAPNSGNKTTGSPPAMKTVDPSTTGSTANGDSGMPNSNGDSQGCSGSATNTAGSKPGIPASNAPGANCQ